MSPFQKKSLNRDPQKALRMWSFSKKGRSSFRKKRKFPWKIILLVLFFLFLLGVGFAYFLFSKYILADLPDINDERNLIFSESTVLYDKTGEEKLYTVHGDENRNIVPINEMSKHIVSAMLAAEDDQFFRHAGFDIGGITKAFCHEFFGNLGGLCPPRGGSTITQQMIKNFVLTSERTIIRKGKEIVLAYRIEKKYSKEKILEIYLNGISFGSNISGVEVASQAFFQVPAKDVSPAQAALLASMPQAPSRYSPFGPNVRSHILLTDEELIEKNIITLEELQSNNDYWQYGLLGQNITLAGGDEVFLAGRANWVLNRMHTLGYITEEQKEEGEKEMLEMTFEPYRTKLVAPHFVMWVREQLVEKFGEELVEHGGLKVITTIDLKKQAAAEEAIAERKEKNLKSYNAKNAALIAIHPKTGEVESMVGSSDYWDDEIDGKVNILLKKRLPGSSFKPIVFAAAFASGKLSPASVLFDVETNFGNGWTPNNYDGYFRGPVTIRKALGNSLNIHAIKAAIIAGPEKVYDLATHMGILFDFDSDFYGAAIALGGAEARPLDMASAFATFANGGKKIEPNSILLVEDRFGNILYSAQSEEVASHEEKSDQALDAGVAYLIADMLSDQTVRGPGWNDRLQLEGRKNIVKTGTADKKVDGKPQPADCWTIGGTPSLMTAVWTGNSRGEVMASEASGYATAAPIWHSFMSTVLAEEEPEEFEIPETVSRIQVSKLSGLLPSEGMAESLITDELFARVNMPQKEDTSLSFVEIDSVSGKLPTEYTPQETIVRRPVLNMTSYFPNWEAWEKPVQEWLSGNAGGFLNNLGISGDILMAAPTEYDDVHTPVTLESAPTVSFVSPSSSGNVSSPKTTVLMNISAENGFQKIVFSWNGRVLKSFTTKQEAYIIPVPPSARGTNVIQAEVFDKYSLSGNTSVQVKIKEDTTGPSLSILYPSAGEKISTGAFVTFSVRAVDKEGAVQKVDFFVDGKRIGSDVRLYDESSGSEYEYIWQSPNEPGEHELKILATDVSGNKTSKNLNFSLVKRSVASLFSVASPKTGSTFGCNDSVSTVIGISQDMTDTFDHLEIIAEDSKRQQTTIANFIKVPASGFFETKFQPKECGEYIIFAKVFLENGVRRTSGKARITLEE